jgi:hypothetical protein
MLIDVQPTTIEDAVRLLRYAAVELAEHHRARGDKCNARQTRQWETAAALARALKRARDERRRNAGVDSVRGGQE